MSSAGNPYNAKIEKRTSSEILISYTSGVMTGTSTDGAIYKGEWQGRGRWGRWEIRFDSPDEATGWSDNKANGEKFPLKIKKKEAKAEQAKAEKTNLGQNIEAENKLSATDWFEKGKALGDAGRHQEAIEACSKAIDLDPKHAVTYVVRGLAYANIGDHRQAIKDYDRAIELDSRNAPAYANRGFAYGNLDNYQQTLADSNKAIELNPKFAEAYYNRGVAYHHLGDYQQALNNYKTAAKLGYKPAEEFLTSQGISW